MLNIIGVILLLTVTCLSGVVIFAYYVQQGCDPLTSHTIGNPNQVSHPGARRVLVGNLFDHFTKAVSSCCLLNISRQKMLSTIRLIRRTGQDVIYDTRFHWSTAVKTARIMHCCTTKSDEGSGSSCVEERTIFFQDLVKTFGFPVLFGLIYTFRSQTWCLSAPVCLSVSVCLTA